MKGKLTRLPRAEQWANQICAQLGKSVESIIDVGRLLLKAKADLVHGEWGRMFSDELVPFSRQTAFRLMAIAEHPQLSNVTHVQHLPPSWGSLYELTKVEPKRLSAAFKDGIITPDMQRRDVKALLPPTRRQVQRAAIATEPTPLPTGPFRILFLIDEKKRATKNPQTGQAYLDVLLEEWSVFHGERDSRNKIGWALDRRKRCDFVAYAIPHAGICYLLPFELARLAFTMHRSAWTRAFGVRDAKNPGYVTRNIPVPWRTLHAAIVEQMHRGFVTPAHLHLPTPAIVDDQLTFGWGE